ATFDWLVKRQNAIASDPLTFYSMLLFVLESANADKVIIAINVYRIYLRFFTF
ncbi:hypothetical protein AAKU64_002711, partial [Undibacterium sp. GrIS 1.8]